MEDDQSSHPAASMAAVPPIPHGPPAVHVARFTASPLGDITTLTFFAFAGTRVGQPPVLAPAFTAALVSRDIRELRDVLNSVLASLQTLTADEANPQ